MSPARWMSRRHPAAGFSLVELLVALALTGLVLAMLILVTRQWLPQWHRGIDRVENSEQMALALDRMAADIAAITFVPATRERPRPLFEGLGNALIFVRTALGPNARPGLEMVRLAEDRSAGGVVLTRSTAPYLPRDPETPLPVFGAPVTLLRPPYRVVFSFAGSDGIWQEQWQELDELPRAIRIVVRDGTTGRALDVSTAVMLGAQLPASCVTDPQQHGCDGDALPTDAAPPAEPDQKGTQ
ncbi:prepilin-type N-terminal cleavage/methylation domain-containing protein [Xanthobacter sp. KR7-65]|uniref:PulJ/GspJ family protein n=1 Tax=Xanthobacter sp. KR7-65 TaxID=3156612 RepID=UPI0032B395F4